MEIDKLAPQWQKKNGDKRRKYDSEIGNTGSSVHFSEKYTSKIIFEAVKSAKTRFQAKHFKR